MACRNRFAFPYGVQLNPLTLHYAINIFTLHSVSHVGVYFSPSAWCLRIRGNYLVLFHLLFCMKVMPITLVQTEFLKIFCLFFFFFCLWPLGHRTVQTGYKLSSYNFDFHIKYATTQLPFPPATFKLADKQRQYIIPLPVSMRDIFCVK